MTVVRATTSGRLDRVLRDRFPELGRRGVDRLIATQAVRVNRQPARLSSWQVQVGDELEIPEDALLSLTESAIQTKGRFANTRFSRDWLIHEDNELVVVNKPEGLRSEPVRADDTTPNLLALARSEFGDVTLAHRLDRDTSGVVLLTRSAPMRRYLDELFRTHRIVKRYLAVVEEPNDLEESGMIRHPLKRDPSRRERMVVTRSGGDPARTGYRVLERTSDRALVELMPETGRTHQLRVHLASVNAPILGDRLYGNGESVSRLLLHACEISFPAESGDRSDVRTFSAPIPGEFSVRR